MNSNLSTVRTWADVALVLGLGFVGLAIGGATGVIPLAPILAAVLPVVAATFLLRREGIGWRELGVRPIGIRSLTIWVAATLALVFLVAYFFVTPVMRILGAPPLNVAGLANLLEGNTTAYLIFLIPISWGSAGFGEELIARGFLRHRFDGLYGPVMAVMLQAALFAGAHWYQGPMGVANVFVLALIFGTVFYRVGRNLWPLFMAHALIDTYGVTMLYLGRADLLIGS